MAQSLNRSLFVCLLSLFAGMILSGCSKPVVVVDGVMPVTIGSKTFELDIVADPKTRERGLGGVTEMAADKGMLFSFPDSKLRRFVMRDCFIDIDIIFLDSAGRITAMHTMPIEEEKREDESQYAYETRLVKYSSRFNAKYAIELVGGMIDTLGIEDGQQIDLDTAYLESVTQ